jgi:hypothetical protein
VTIQVLDGESPDGETGIPGPSDDDWKFGFILGSQLRVVSVDIDRDDNLGGADGRDMGPEDVCTDTCLKIPDTDGAICRSRYESIGLSVKRRGPDPAFVAYEGLKQLACECAVDFDDVVVESEDDAVMVQD